MSVLSVRVTEEIEQQPNALAKSTGRSKSWLASQAMQDYLNSESWQVVEIEQAIAEADAGDFSSADEVAAKMKKWGTHTS